MNTPHHTERTDGIGGVRVAIVRDNEDDENLGRVKLEYPWRDEDDESYWARIATEMAGKEYGTYYLPEVGDEVLVGFENGDIHNPIVLGALWSGNRKPPEDNGDGKNDIRTITTRSGHKIEFNDNESEGSVHIETVAGHTVTLDDENGSESVSIEDKAGNSMTLDSTKDSITIAANKELNLEAPTINISGDQEVTIEGMMVEMAGDTQTDISSGAMMSVEAGGIMDISADAPLSISGAIIQLN